MYTNRLKDKRKVAAAAYNNPNMTNKTNRSYNNIPGIQLNNMPYYYYWTNS